MMISDLGKSTYLPKSRASFMDVPLDFGNKIKSEGFGLHYGHEMLIWTLYLKLTAEHLYRQMKLPFGLFIKQIWYFSRQCNGVYKYCNAHAHLRVQSQ